MKELKINSEQPNDVAGGNEPAKCLVAVDHEGTYRLIEILNLEKIHPITVEVIKDGLHEYESTSSPSVYLVEISLRSIYSEWSGETDLELCIGEDVKVEINLGVLDVKM